jgi:hypothetical protein
MLRSISTPLGVAVSNCSILIQKGSIRAAQIKHAASDGALLFNRIVAVD